MISETGKIGEGLAVDYLKSEGFKILEKNFRTKFGELDIVCKKGKLLVFVEVKAAVSGPLTHDCKSVGNEAFQPEQHFTKQKITRLKRAAEIFLIKNKLPSDTEQRLDLAALDLDEEKKLLNLRYYENVTG